MFFQLLSTIKVTCYNGGGMSLPVRPRVKSTESHVMALGSTL